MKTKNLREQGKVVFIKQMKTKGAEKGNREVFSEPESKRRSRRR
jgi:hypothetical protein